MPRIKLKVFNTQSSAWEIDEDIDASTMRDVQARVNPGANDRYTDRATREAAFSNPDKLVTGDITLFKSASKSKAGDQKQ